MLKALKLLREKLELQSRYQGVSGMKPYINETKEAIEELEALNNRSCENCRHLEKKEKNLKFECLLEVCRTCTRNNNDNWEVKNERN
ncbi:hypothetical protein [Aliarcobacter butzleri]|uniref:hypothetical protein n=1 Tax=Aliarcobacter butzleri TaxID=28197 RepID=UPI00215AFC85|nr:hypothetical protein [Aliarcobacter butzleri]MCR8711307.1 hypothetical protein [Aliarcobacter butzleri]